MSLWIGAIEYILVQFSCEVSCESMDLRLLLLHCECDSIEHFHRLLVVLWQFLVFLSVRVWNVSKCEYWLGLVTTWKVSRVDLYNVWQFKWVMLLVQRNTI